MTRQHHIAVAPVEGGWALACDEGLAPMMFLSGARAEAQARSLAQRLSAAGDEVQLTVSDRSQTIIGRARYLPAEMA